MKDERGKMKEERGKRKDERGEWREEWCGEDTLQKKEKRGPKTSFRKNNRFRI